MPSEKDINKPKQLIVEGKDDEWLVGALLKRLNITDVQIHDLEGVSNLRPLLRALVLSPGFQDDVYALGILRDADNSSANQLRSVKDALRAVNLPVPTRSLQVAGGNPKTLILIVPHEEQTGAIEDVCMASVEADVTYGCVEEYMECVQEKVDISPNHLAKAKVQTFLAARSRPGLRLGEAAEADYWDFNHSSFDPLKELLQLL